MGQRHSFSAPPESSSEFCSSCGGTGFRAVPGGVVPCRRCQKKQASNSPTPSPTISKSRVISNPTSKAPTQRQKLILFLRKRGDKGPTNVELATTLKILRYSSRIFSCRKSGYVIEAVDEGNGIWRYFLRHEPAVECSPYVFQETSHSEQDQPKLLVGVTVPLFPSATGTGGP